jgi:outer membrane protein OmpA-like peptidoglycan-associated protein
MDSRSESLVVRLLQQRHAERRVLGQLDISTVYDFAASRIFSVAEILCRLGADSLNFLASDLVDNDRSLAVHDDLGDAPVILIQGIGKKYAKDLDAHLGIETVRDLATWPPFLAARAVYEAAEAAMALPEPEAPADAPEGDAFYEPPSAPPEYIPMLGQHATEQRFYSQVYLDHVIRNDLAPPASLPGPVNLMQALGTSAGFTQPALGAVLTLSQDWTPEAMALGTVLHSVTLAPGEVTKIAVVEWSRRSSARTQEELGQRETVSARLDQRQAIDEVQSGVVTEELSGKSNVTNLTETEQFGAGLGGSLGGAQSTGVGASAGLPAGATGLPADVGVGVSEGRSVSGGLSGGVSYASGKVDSTTDVVTSSKGRRDIHLELSNRVTAGTRQQASSARSRRAAIVQEISQSEEETLKTRVLANYNHMHALTMYYFEVIQVYRTQVKPHRVEPVLFLPFDVLDFRDDSVVIRFRTALLNAALNSRDRALINQASGVVRAITDLGPRQEIEIAGGAQLRDVFMGLGMSRISEMLIELEGDGPPIVISPERQVQLDNGPRLSSIRSISLTLNDKTFEDLKRELPTFYASPESFTRFVLSFGFILNGRMNWIQANGNISSTPRASQPILRVQTLVEDASIAATLAENRLHYSQAVWRSLDPQSMAHILAQIPIDQFSAGELVDPRPVAVHGNMVGFRLSLPEDAEFRLGDIENISRWWQSWKDRNYDPGVTEDSLVAMPTGGVHGEAVLGRSNSAEKLDITRFWNWQDSPIPIQPSEIAPLQAGVREVAQAATPGSLDAPVVSIQNAPPLPGAQGFGAISSVLGQPGLFRDASGVVQASTATGQGIGAATSAAANAQDASARFAALAAEVDKARIAAAGQMASSAMVAASKAQNSISRSGAHLNDVAKHGSAEDRKKAGEEERNPVGAEHQRGQKNVGETSQTRGGTGGGGGSGSEGSRSGTGSGTGNGTGSGSGSGSGSGGGTPRNKPPSRAGTTQGSTYWRYMDGNVLIMNFPVDRAELLPQHDAGIEAVLREVKAGRHITRFEGRASSSGSAAHNMELSRSRMENVVFAFSDIFDDPAFDGDPDLEAEPLGETDPLSTRVFGKEDIYSPYDQSVLVILSPSEDRTTDPEDSASDTFEEEVPDTYRFRVKLPERSSGTQLGADSLLDVGTLDVEIEGIYALRPDGTQPPNVTMKGRFQSNGIRYRVFTPPLDGVKVWTEWVNIGIPVSPSILSDEKFVISGDSLSSGTEYHRAHFTIHSLKHGSYFNAPKFSWPESPGVSFVFGFAAAEGGPFDLSATLVTHKLENVLIVPSTD